ncbi:MAG TPA: sulfatase-like hydrolase/transferase [Bryobacteraceae bacterium]|nr:sulfatase-like hydrolase/transferase [Bryobacteraceae bacterium]
MNLSRRRFFFLGSLALPPLAAAKSAPDRPNLLLILADGLPAMALKCYGGADFHTPNIDQLSESGVFLREHFSASPSAGPGRASLLTGRTPMQLGGGESIPSDEFSLARILGAAGYACLAADMGSSDSVTAQTLKFIDDQTSGHPFFLTAGFTDLTPPYDGVAQKYRDLYAKTVFEPFYPIAPPSPAARAGKEMLADPIASLRKAAAAVSALDDRVGAIVAHLRQRQLLDNTVVVFTATCGALFGKHGLWGAGDSSSPVNMFEESVRTPLIFRWPLKLPPQTSRPESIGSCDFLPTICDLTGAALPAKNLPGRSYLPLLLGKPLPAKKPWPKAVFSRLGDTDMCRDSLFKLILRDDGKEPGEFYDLQSDPKEATNGYEDGQFASIRPQLQAEIAKWKKQYSA